MDLDNIPSNLHHLVSIAKQWGISDDYNREIAIERSSDEELLYLVKTLDDNETAISEWLYNSDGTNKIVSNEYASFTSLTMAYDSALFELKKRKKI